MAVPYLSYTDIQREAARVAASHNPSGRLPVDIEEIIDVDYGINIMPRQGLMDRFQIDAYITHDLTEIVVDRRIYDQRPPNRYRFSLAHEFAHLILHPGVYGNMSFSTPDEWKQAMDRLGATDYSWLEWHANAFAGLLLVPPDPLRANVELLRQQIASGGLNPDQLDVQSADRMLRILGQTFAVSTAVIRRRIEKDELWKLPQEP